MESASFANRRPAASSMPSFPGPPLPPIPDIPRGSSDRMSLVASSNFSNLSSTSERPSGHSSPQSTPPYPSKPHMPYSTAPFPASNPSLPEHAASSKEPQRKDTVPGGSRNTSSDVGVGSMAYGISSQTGYHATTPRYLTNTGPVISNRYQPGAPLPMVGGVGIAGMPPLFRAMHGHRQPYPLYGQHQTQERPFKCDICPQSFNRNHDLKRHKRIHMAVKPFPCTHCDKSFSRKDALKVFTAANLSCQPHTDPFFQRHRLVKCCGALGDSVRSVSPSGIPSGNLSTGSRSQTSATTTTSVYSLPVPKAAIEVTVETSPKMKKEAVGRGQSCPSPVSFPIATRPTSSRASTPPMTALPTVSPGLAVSLLVPVVRSQSAKDEATDSMCSHTPRSELGSVATETFLDERKSKMIDSVIRDITNKIKAMFLQAADGSGSASNSSGQHMASNQYDEQRTTTASMAGKERTLKRKMNDRGGGDSGDEDENTSNYRQQTATEPGEKDARYGYPYFKYNPSLYQNARSCPGPGWLDVHRVKLVLLSPVLSSLS